MMNIQRFTAPTAREALSKARLTFGDKTLILSNRTTDSGVEVLATGEDALEALGQLPDVAARSKSAALPKSQASTKPDMGASVESDTTQLAMSTLSFQDYVRERMLRRRHEALAPQRITGFTGQEGTAAGTSVHSQRPTSGPADSVLAQPTTTTQKSIEVSAGTRLSQGIVDELQAMKALIEERFNTLTWLGQARQSPIQSNLMLKLIRSGYSPTLARTILERMPDDADAAASMRWVMDVLGRNLKADPAAAPLHEEGGAYALIGATGVGKTTTAAKLAGLCARKHGASSVGLVTLDTYRVGAHEQLRSYGRMLGVVAHLAHDRAALQDLLQLLSNKKMVLIDTTGLAPNDPRRKGMLDVLDLPGLNRLLVLNAGSQGDALEDVVTSYKSGPSQLAVLSKVDEANKLGTALDTVIRHQLILRGVTMGQQVPEDWETADAANLVRMSMRSPAKSAFDPRTEDLGFIFGQSPGSQKGLLHA